MVIWPGGRISLLITDCFQSLISYPVFLILTGYVFLYFNWGKDIAPVMMDRAAGESYLNPFDISQLRDFNLFALVFNLTNSILNRAAWIGNDTSGSGRTPHEQKMANILGTWRNGFAAVMQIVIALMIICFMFARRLAFYRLWGVMTIFIIVGFVLFGAVSALAFPVLFPGHESFGEMASKLLPRLIQTNSEPYRWLFNPNTAMVSCVIPMVWAGMGPGCLIYLAALKGIPEDYYEAADLDGATFIDKILFVVFPTLKALIVINFVGAFIGSWYASTGNILVMTGGDAATKTETAGLYIWYKAFTYLNFGPATAAAWMLAFILIGFTVYQLQILSKVEFKNAGASAKK